jgi:hypothetical protein
MYAIVDVPEDQFTKVEDLVKMDVTPRVTKLEATTGGLFKDIDFFKKNIGTNVPNRIKTLEELLKPFELTAGTSLSADVGEIRCLLIKEIILAVRDLWNFYILATKDPGGAVMPGPGEPAGTRLSSQILALESAGSTLGGGGPTIHALEHRIQTLENQALPSGHQANGGLPSLFGPSFGARASGGGLARGPSAPSGGAAVANISH